MLPIIIKGLLSIGVVELVADIFDSSANDLRARQRAMHVQRNLNYRNVEYEKKIKIKNYLMSLRNDALSEKEIVENTLEVLKHKQDIIIIFLNNTKLSGDMKQKFLGYIKITQDSINRHIEEIRNIDEYINNISERIERLDSMNAWQSIKLGELTSGL